MKAMILCAGLGTRMGELTRQVPKPMLPLQGRPLLAYLLGHLRGHGFRQIAINLHFLPEMIRDHFGDGSRWHIELTYSAEPELLGTAGGVKKLGAFFHDEPEFLVQYGDVVTDQDLAAVLRFHRERQALATLLLHRRSRSNSVVGLDAESRIVSFLERPPDSARPGLDSPWVNSGVYILSPEILDHVPADTVCDWPRDIFPRLVSTGRLFGFALSGYRCAVDSPSRLAEVREAIASNRCHVVPL